MSRFIVLSVVIGSLFLAACSGAAPTATLAPVAVVGTQVQVPGGAYTDVSAVELHTMLANKDFVLVNVHIPFDGNIAGTDLSIPYDQIAQNLDKLPEKAAKIVLYCRSGRMSDIAAKELVSQGYTNVWNLSGGMAAWEQAGLDIQR